MEGFTMTVSETDRLDMLVGLRMHLGDSVANTLIEHLPPGGWQDVARIADTDRLQRDVNRLHDDFAQLRNEFQGIRQEFQGLRQEFQNLREEFQKLSDRYDTTMKWLIGISLTYGIGILGCAVGVLAVALRQ
jgi:FtsZ-binding cell division protein ZapB